MAFGIPPIAVAAAATLAHGAAGYTLGGHGAAGRAMMRWGAASCGAMSLASFYFGKEDEYVRAVLVATSCAAMGGLCGLHVVRVGGTAANNHILAAQTLIGANSAMALDQAYEAWRHRPL